MKSPSDSPSSYSHTENGVQNAFRRGPKICSQQPGKNSAEVRQQIGPEVKHHQDKKATRDAAKDSLSVFKPREHYQISVLQFCTPGLPKSGKNQKPLKDLSFKGFSFCGQGGNRTILTGFYKDFTKALPHKRYRAPFKIRFTTICGELSNPDSICSPL